RQSVLINKKTNVDNLEKKYSQCLAEYEPLQLLDKDINGGNSKKQNLYKWILGTYFEEVVIAASLRFNHMSSGRYTLQLETDRQGGRGDKGLDIIVIDSYTGKNRTVDTLSGGEIFEASLSLALALTDIVQQKSGGVSLDSLFIDEGFGSLDPETLENAISVIDQIREHRMVGIISHVEQLALAISCHVEVEKKENGSVIH
ncbi:MAG: exonuclease SbcC, partial [Treponema sp.]|nr:exonuclease SbcC [Treponema sp.]